MDVIMFANFLATLNFKNKKDVSSQDCIGGILSPMKAMIFWFF